MEEWKKVHINRQNIKHATAKSVLVAMPHRSSYDGYCFWHPKKLVREGSHSYDLTLSFTDGWKFKLTKKSRDGKVLDEDELSAEDMIDELGDSSGEHMRPYGVQEKPLLHKPAELTPVEGLEADKELVDAD